MSISLKVVIEEAKNGTYFDLTDTTGAYNVVDNTTGWGAPNEATTTVESIVVSVQLVGDSAPWYFTFSITSGTIDSLFKTDLDGVETEITPFYPTTFDSSFSFRFLASYFGLEKFEDGFNEIRYTVNGTADATPYTYFAFDNGGSFFIADLVCCKNSKLSKKALLSGCGCGDIDELLNLDLYIQSITASATCNKINAANQAFVLASNICDGGCKSC